MMGVLPNAGQMTLGSSEWLELLLNVSLKGVVLLMAASVLSYVLRRASSAARHLVWNLALCGLLALPVLSFVLPAWRAPLLPASSAESVTNETIPTIGSEEVRQEQSPLPGGKAGAVGLPPINKFPEVADAQDERLRSERAGSQKDHPAIFARTSWPMWAVIVWLAGALAVMVRLLVGTIRVWWMARRASEIAEGDWPLRMQNLCRQLHLTRRVRLLESGRVTMPLTWGIFRPTILLPVGAEGWPEERRSVVLLHELAHVKRRDCLTQMLAQIACALYWFNPLVWLAARRLRIERERACDDYVLGAGTKASDYAGHLLDIARSFGEAKCSSLATVAIARRSQLEGRLLAILDPKLSRRRLNPSGMILSGVVVASLVLPLAALHPVARAQGMNAPVELITRESRHLTALPTPTPTPIPVPAMLPEEGEATVQPEEQEPEGLDRITDTPAPQAAQEAGAQERKDNSRVVEALKEALKDEDPDVRRSALFALGQMGDSSVTEAMIEALKSNDSQVRAQAAWALGMRGGQNAVEALIEALKDESAHVRAQAAWALGMKGNGRATEALAAALRDENSHVRAQAAWALGMRGSRDGVEALATALKDENANVRAQSAWALGMRGDSRAVESLAAALKDSNANVRAQAA
ncbi:MAG: M56 family metallopeptidase, partial [Blastocatellia bacterium]|nr:M56 family metallopeptidase [Blastocatellia bacterium]